MPNQLDGTRVAFMVANEGVEQVELTEPWAAVERAGGHPVLIAPEAGDVQAVDHLDAADVFQAHQGTADAVAQSFDALVLPGGVANPDQLRTDAAAVQLVRDMIALERPIAVICHGPWTMIEADVVRDRRMTSWPSLQTDLRNAGATWVDEPVVVCDGGPSTIISSRNPDDLPAFCDAILGVCARRTPANA